MQSVRRVPSAVDRTADFQSAVRTAALRSGANAVRRAPSHHPHATLLSPSCVQEALAAQTLLRPACAPSDFHRLAAAVGASVRALRAFVAAKRAEYCDPLGCSDAERDATEAEVADALRDCRERIDHLARAAPRAAQLACGGGEARSEVLAHHTGVALLLAERLEEAASRFDRARAQRARLALQAAAQRRSAAPVAPPKARARARARSSDERASHAAALQPARGRGEAGASRIAGSAASEEGVEASAGRTRLPLQQQQQLEAENQVLAEELNSYVDDVSRPEVACASALMLRDAGEGGGGRDGAGGRAEPDVCGAHRCAG